MRRRIAAPVIASVLVLLTACGAEEGSQPLAPRLSEAGHGEEGSTPRTRGPKGAPSTSTAAPSTSTAAPSTSTAAPSTSTAAPSTSTEPLPADPVDPVEPGLGGRADRLGVSIPAADLHHAGVEAMNARLDEVVALGARWVRTDANWSWIEPRQGAPDWSELDALMSAADARRLNVLLIVGRMPEWARPAGTTELHGPSSATEQSLFADFAGRLATRYAAQVDAWEVWNEPNLDQFWAPSPDPADYAAVLRAVYPVVKSADPATPILSGGSGGAELGDMDSVTWYREVYANGAKPYFDAAGMHPYQDWRAAASGHQDTGEMARVPAVRQIMTENGDGTKPMWGTEFGAPTSGSTATTEDGQRVVYTDGRDLWFSRESGVLFAYFGRDRLAYGTSTSRSPYWGLMRSDGAHKPAHDALAAWVAAG